MGIRITGSSDTIVNGLKVSRSPRDLAVHTCPHCSVNMCITGSPSVITNGLNDHRLNDVVTEFCGVGNTITASPDTFDDSM